MSKRERERGVGGGGGGAVDTFQVIIDAVLALITIIDCYLIQ